MVIALLVSLSLVFTSAQVYRIQSTSAEVQDIADAAALAAENQVAEFMLIARMCDAVILSLSLTGLGVSALATIALCVPIAAPFSEPLLKAGNDLIRACNEFSEKACAALNRYQKALPFLASVRAAGVAQVNGARTSGASYLAVAVLLPVEGVELKSNAYDAAEKILDSIDEKASDLRNRAKEAEDAAQRANEAKRRAFERDCGDNPNYCMYERAQALAGLEGPENPLYSSVDLWSFSVALNRARVYYATRLANERPDSSAYADQARSYLRERFYRYAVDQLADAYVIETDGTFEAWFPRFPRNTAEMRETSLYDEAAYPIALDTDGCRVMHAWPGCPGAIGASEWGSIRLLEQGDFEECPVCMFRASSMGSVAAASTSIENGFEYHYDAVAVEAAQYEKERRASETPANEVRSTVNEILGQLVDYAKQVAVQRIDARPPGRLGAVAFAANVGASPAASVFSNAFVSNVGSLGPSAAVAGATLVDEGTAEGKTVISSFLDGLRQNGNGLAGATGIVLDVWSCLLCAYANGQDALIDAIEQGLDGLPLVSAAGLGSWAAEKLRGVINDIGLQPAQVGALKPLLVNTGHIAAADTGEISARYVSLKQQAISHPLMSTDLFSSLLIEARRVVVAQIDGLGDTVEIASIELFDGAMSIPLSIPLPNPIRDGAASAIDNVFSQLEHLYVSATGVKTWE